LYGHLEVVKWLCPTNAMDHAATNGHLDVVEWLHTDRTEGCTKKDMDYAATHEEKRMRLLWCFILRLTQCIDGLRSGAAVFFFFVG